MAHIINTTTYFLLAVLIALSFGIFWFFRYAFSYWKKRGLPYLEPIIPFGNAANVYRKCTLGEIFAQWYLQLKERGVEHGGAYFFWKPVYIPVDEKIIKRILISDSENFPNHGMYIREDIDPISGHIFNMEGAKWKTLRSKMPAVFTSAKMRKMFLIMEKMTNKFVQNLNVYAESGNPIHIKQETSRFTVDIISACALGLESKTMHHENEEMLTQGRLFFDSQWNIYRNTAVLTIPHHILQKFNFRIMPKVLENYYINLCRNLISYRKKNPLNRNDLTETLIRLTEQNGHEYDFTGKKLMEPLSLEEFAAQICVFFSAGFETSSGVQSFAMYELARNPECQLKLREEINRVLAKYDNQVTYDAVMEMKYLDNVVDETLRLYPVFPILPRVCINDYKVPGTDFTIEKNTFIMVTNMGIQRDPEYYPNPDQFDPDRFTNENKSTRPLMSHLPFGEGPRICVGKRFGLLQTKLGLVTVLKNFNITINEDKTIPSFKFEPTELILRKAGDIWLNLQKVST